MIDPGNQAADTPSDQADHDPQNSESKSGLAAERGP
jgi:hypothetical protein